MPGKALLNGKPIDAAQCADRGLHFGDGLFETIALVDGRPCLWSRHMARLSRGCERLALAVPDQDLLREEADRVSAGIAHGVLKLILTAGEVERGYARVPQAPVNRWIRCSDWPGGDLYNTDRALSVAYCQLRLGGQPRLAGIKHLNRLEQVLARRELDPSVDEGLMLNQAGELVEGIAANLLACIDGRWVTPPITDCGVAGVVRELLLEQAASYGETLVVETLTPAQIEHASEVWLSSSLLGVRRVGRIAGRVLPELAVPAWLQGVRAACFTVDGV